MNTDFIILITTTSLSTMAIIITLFTIFMNIAKRIDDVKDNIRLLDSKFDRLDEAVTCC